MCLHPGAMSIPHGSGSLLHLQVKMLNFVKFLTFTDTTFKSGDCSCLICSPSRKKIFGHILLKKQETVKSEPTRTSLPMFERAVHTGSARKQNTYIKKYRSIKMNVTLDSNECIKAQRCRALHQKQTSCVVTNSVQNTLFTPQKKKIHTNVYN